MDRHLQGFSEGSNKIKHWASVEIFQMLGLNHYAFEKPYGCCLDICIILKIGCMYFTGSQGDLATDVFVSVLNTIYIAKESFWSTRPLLRNVDLFRCLGDFL